jgi:uncharacterized protein (DUF427 family)
MTDVPFDLEAARRHWRAAPRVRPPRIEPPDPGQESVWDYTRPPRLEPVARPVRVAFAGRVVAESDRALRVCETASPPVYYVPRGDVCGELLLEECATFCEWKGVARYWVLRVGERLAPCAAFDYPRPDPPYQALAGHLAFYPGRVDACWLGGEQVRPQPGAFYAGWITDDVRGPFKGGPGSERW